MSEKSKNPQGFGRIVYDNIEIKATLRDHFAGQALAELVKVAYYHPSVHRDKEEPTEADRIARHAYLYADAMLKARSAIDDVKAMEGK